MTIGLLRTSSPGEPRTKGVCVLLFTFDPQVFKKSFIPRTLTDVSHYERDVEVMKASDQTGSDVNVSE